MSGDVAVLGVGAFRELEERRRAWRLHDWNVIDALYKAYVTALIGAVGLLWLSGVVAEEEPEPVLARIADHGPGVLGVVLASLIWAGVVSGQKGGPLNVVPAMVRLVLLAPVDRGAVLRRSALRSLRFGAFSGAVVGAAVGVFAYRRLAGPPLSWLVATTAFGAVAGMLVPASGLVVSANLVRPAAMKALVGLFGMAAVVDAATGTARTPLGLAGLCGLAPLAHTADAGSVHVAGGATVLALLALIVAGAGVRGCGGVTLESIERRSRLIALLRFAATMRDLRAVILLRRQLGQEMPRSRPWWRLPAGGRLVVWRRDLHGLMRWPPVRFLRLGGLGVVAGASTLAAVAGTGELVMVAALALYVAAAEATEGFAQEVDRPTLQASHPVDRDLLWARHLSVPTAVMTGVGLVAVLTAAAIAGVTALAALAIVVPGALVASVVASRQALVDPAAEMQLMLADATGGTALFKVVGPPVMAASGPVLLVVLLHVELGAEGALPLPNAIRAVVLIQALVGIGAVGYRVARANRALASGGRALSPVAGRG